MHTVSHNCRRIYMLLTCILLAVSVAAQAKGGRLIVSCDADCTWKLDGKDQGALKKKDKATVEVSEGEHLIEATSSDGVYLWKKAFTPDKPNVNVRIGLVHDAPWIDKTGLMWEARDNGKNINYEDAVEYCHQLKVGAYTNWRLPKAFEVSRNYDLMRVRASTQYFLYGDIKLSTGILWTSDYKCKVYNGTYTPCQPDSSIRALCVRDTVTYVPSGQVGTEDTGTAGWAQKADEPNTLEKSENTENYKNRMFSYGVPARVDQPRLLDGPETVFRAETQEVLVKVTVTSKHDQIACAPITIDNLNANDVTIYDNGVPVKIRYFKRVVREPRHFEPGAWSVDLTRRGSWSRIFKGGYWLTPSYYVIGFVPTAHRDGECRNVRASAGKGYALVEPSQYCYSNMSDPLRGTDIGKTLEAAANANPKVNASIEATINYYYVRPNIAQVHVDVDMPSIKTRPSAVSDNVHETRGYVLGLIYGSDGSIVGRFSDNWFKQIVGSDFAFPYTPLHFSTELELPPGKYLLKLAYSDEKEVSSAQAEVLIGEYAGNVIGISSISAENYVRTTDAMYADEPQLSILNPTPLISNGAQYFPVANRILGKTEPLYVYFELYEPLLQKTAVPIVKFRMKILDIEDGAVKMDSGMLDAAKYFQKDSIVIPIGQEINIKNLSKGCYHLEVQGFGFAGQSTPVRSEQFCVK